jgi:ribosomal protein L29
MARAPKKKADAKPAPGEKVNRHASLRAKTNDELVDQLVGPEEGAVQSPLPARHTAAREAPARVRTVRREIAQ